MIERWLHNIAYPMYQCENCIGMMEYGCYCSAMDAGGPGVPPTLKQKIARIIYSKFFEYKF